MHPIIERGTRAVRARRAYGAATPGRAARLAGEPDALLAVVAAAGVAAAVAGATPEAQRDTGWWRIVLALGAAARPGGQGHQQRDAQALRDGPPDGGDARASIVPRCRRSHDRPRLQRARPRWGPLAGSVARLVSRRPDRRAPRVYERRHDTVGDVTSLVPPRSRRAA